MTTARKPARTPAAPQDMGSGINDTAGQQAEALREAAREMARPHMRDLLPGEFLNRAGEIVSIKRDPKTNIFEIPAHLQDPEYTLEWKREETYGKRDDTHQVHLAENGWRPVLVEPGSPWAGHFMEVGYKGPVRRDGMILMERPAGLTKIVKERERREANGQMQANVDRYNGRRAVEVPQGFTTNNPNVPSRVQSSYDIGPAPSKHQLAID